MVILCILLYVAAMCCAVASNHATVEREDFWRDLGVVLASSSLVLMGCWAIWFM